MDCNCNLNRCILCKDKQISNMKKKIEKYKETLNYLLDENLNDTNYINNTSNTDDNYDNSDLYESIIIYKDNDGYTQKKINSNLGESFLIVENGKDLSELNKNELRAVNKQNNLRKYEKIKKYVKKTNSVYGIISSVAKIGKYFIGLF